MVDRIAYYKVAILYTAKHIISQIQDDRLSSSNERFLTIIIVAI